MSRYIIRRLLLAVPVLFGVTIVTFMLTELAPGDAVTAIIMARRMEDPEFEPGDEEAMRRLFGLDKPAHVRYLKWMGNVLQGNMGLSLLPPRTPIIDKIKSRIVPTLELMVTALVTSTVLGIILGMISAVKQYSWFDYISTLLVFGGISIPAFFAALWAIFIFGLNVSWLPTSGYSTLTEEFGFWDGIVDHLRYLILPASVLGIESMASIMRYTRSSMLETLRTDYITVARAKGLTEVIVIARHALRNALLPVLTIIGLRLPALFGGALIIESIFGWPGTGSLYIEGVNARDYPLIMGMVLISASLIVASNLITDFAYAVADPRIRYE
jgi:peptide/nickel transport system permease protein